MNIIPASEIIKDTLAVEANYENRIREKAMKFLTKENFNERVKIAASAGSWRLGRPLRADNNKLADEVVSILTDAGYIVKRELCYNLKVELFVSWPHPCKLKSHS